ncbi:MAG: AAA family ATPase, partial [SAR324 cluster bacterium]|nr:AAA family ATPase [SAR324 cluster bacterium]
QVTEQVTEQATEQATEQVTEQADRNRKIFDFCEVPRSANEIMVHLQLTHREYFRSEILKPLLEGGLLQPTIPDKPKSPKQKYQTVKE